LPGRSRLEIGFHPDFLRGTLESVDSGVHPPELSLPLRPVLIEASDGSGFLLRYHDRCHSPERVGLGLRVELVIRANFRVSYEADVRPRAVPHS